MSNVKKVHVKGKILFIYALAIFIGSLVFYFTIPYLLNYGPGTVNTQFDRDVSNGTSYTEQVFFVGASLILVVSLFLSFTLKDINNYLLYNENKSKYKDEIERIKKICLKLPNRLLMIFITIPLILSIAVLFMQTTYLTSSDFKLMLVVFILATTTISITNIFVKKLLSKMLLELENTTTPDIKQFSITKQIMFQILPILAVCILFTYLLISSIYERNNADLLSSFYNTHFKDHLSTTKIDSVEDLINLLPTIEPTSAEDILFITDSEFNFIYSTGELSHFFKKYAAELSAQHNYQIFDYYGSSGQGVLYEVPLENGETYYIGCHYLIYSEETVGYIVFLLGALGLLCAIIIYTFANELRQNIKFVSSSLEEISNSKVEDLSDKKLYITSADEIGDLIKVYNNIQSLTINHLRQIHNNQESLMEKERLASLGQLIGGIAHNLKTPIMSISGAAEGLNDLIKEYDSSIEDPEVTSKDHHEIAKDMSTWVSKIKTHTEYMSDIITAVKGQAINLTNDEDVSFTIGELLKRVNILMKHELKNAITYLNVSMQADENTVINGDVNSLVQVINNMISNSIQAYDGKTEQNIDLTVTTENNKLYISIKDYAKGIPEKVQKKLFKEMITTKGKNGTGLGLYMSYSTIRANFNGTITVESKKDEGTTFTIILPL